MSDTDELLREVEKHTGGTGSERSDADGDRDAGTGQSGGLRSRATGRAASVFSPKSFLVGLVLAAIGLAVAGAVPILANVPVVGQVVGLLGVFAGTFVHGLVAGDRRYVESAVAGGAVAGLAALSEFLVWTFVGFGVPVVVILGVLGAVAGLLGHYSGRDLRAGLSQDL